MFKIKNKQSGQVVLVVLLTLLVGLTMALAIFLNTVSDAQLTTTEENSERAFSAAEAGIEELLSGALVGIGSTGVVNVGGLDANVEYEPVNHFEAYVPQNGVATIQLEGATDTQIRILWTVAGDDEGIRGTCTEGDSNTPAALIIDKWTNPGTGVEVEHFAYNPEGCAAVGSSSLGFSNSVAGIDNYLSMLENFNIDGDNSDGATDLFLRIRPIYNHATIKIEAMNDPVSGLPQQQIDISSSATVDDSGESRAISVVKTVPALPEIFDYALFSGNTIVK